jgi:glutaminyl-tRNA synthetase
VDVRQRRVPDRAGHAYVDSQTAEEMRASRGTLTEPGKDSPFRERSVEENLDLFRRMKAGEFADGAHILRAKIDMASPNINLRDPAIYRIRHATHHNTGDKWCVYPMYTFAHPIEDALENITHSICTLEFEDQRPFYDWLLARLAEGGLLQRPLPQQIEFARLNLTYVVLSKRKLIQLVEEKHVDGWDDPRMPTLVGARRRGYTPEGFRLFAERIGVSKADSLDRLCACSRNAMRDHLNESRPAPHRRARPAQADHRQLPGRAGRGMLRAQPSAEAGTGQARHAVLARTVDRARGLHGSAEQGLLPPVPRQQGAAALRLRRRMHRLRQGRRRQGHRRALQVLPDTKSGTPGADSYKVKGNLHWVSARHAYAAEVRLYDRLFAAPARRRALGGARFHRRPQPGLEADHHRPTRTAALRTRSRNDLPVRAPRLLRRRIASIPKTARRCSTGP